MGNSSDFNNLINTNQALILTKFDSVKKLGDDELIKKFRDEILEDMKRQTDRFREQNENKRLAHSWRTPATILVTNILAQVIGFLLRMVFLGPVAILFGLWSYGSYTDQYQTLRERIDELAEFIGANVLNLGYQSAAKLMTNPALRNAVADLTGNREKKKD